MLQIPHSTAADENSSAHNGTGYCLGLGNGDSSNGYSCLFTFGGAISRGRHNGGGDFRGSGCGNAEDNSCLDRNGWGDGTGYGAIHQQ